MSRFLIPFLTLTVITSSATIGAGTSPRERLSINADWRFQKGDPADAGDSLAYDKIKDWVLPTGNAFTKDPSAQRKRPEGNPGGDISFLKSDFDDSKWRQLNLPHDWAIEGPFVQEYPGETGKLAYWGPVWYRKHLSIPASDQGRRIALQIDGAMSYASVWLNGQFVGGWPYGYSSFQLDLTPYIKPGGDNVLAIRLDSPKNSSRWYPGAGIYRNVWLLKTAPVHVAQWGTYITTPEVKNDSATVSIRVTLENNSTAPAKVSVKTDAYLCDASGKKTGTPVFSIDMSDVSLAAGEQGTLEPKVKIARPRLWTLEKPVLYCAVTAVSQNGRIIDTYETNFGIRTIQFTADNGFLLNGKRVQLQGVCNHHDLGALGSAFNVRAAERQLEIMKEMGVNALRTSHNMPAPELLDLCDRMGILVMDESFDCWKSGKKAGDYHLLWDDWHEKDLRAEVRRDRNHPSIIFWSIGNEVRELGNAVDGPRIASELTAIVAEEDPTRPSVLGSNNGNASYNGVQKSVGVMGQNYEIGGYAKFRKENPTIPLVGSETASTVSSRGEYFFPVSGKKAEGRSDFQVSSYDLYGPGWSWIPDNEFKSLAQNPHVAGEFVWTGFDYLGEPTPYNGDSTNLLNFSDPAEKAKMEEELKALGKIKVPSRSSYFGIVDLAGFKKDRFYLYQAHWRPDHPMAHLLPHWNWAGREGEVTPVFVYTSGDEAELFLNGQSLGRKQKAELEYRLRWDDVKYAPGELKVVAYKNGKKWAEDVVKTTGPVAKLKAQADRATLHADGSDLSFITVALADKNGLVVPRSSNLVQFEIAGPAEIVAVDNGDATSFASFQGKEIKAFNGLALVIVRTQSGKAGAITLKAKSEGLRSAEVSLTSAVPDKL